MATCFDWLSSSVVSRSFSNTRMAIRLVSSCTAFRRFTSSLLAALAVFLSALLALSFGLVYASGSISRINSLTPEHEMAVAPHRRGPNGKLMTPIDRETDVLWGYVAVGPRLLAFISLFLAQTGGCFAHCPGAVRALPLPGCLGVGAKKSRVKYIWKT